MKTIILEGFRNILWPLVFGGEEPRDIQEFEIQTDHRRVHEKV
jgi:hypothetical protein